MTLNKNEEALRFIRQALSVKHHKTLARYLNELEAKQRKITEEYNLTKIHEFNLTNNFIYKNNKDEEININEKSLLTKEINSVEINVEDKICSLSYLRIYKIIKIIFMYILQFIRNHKNILFGFAVFLLYKKRQIILARLKDLIKNMRFT